jgi:hypothetical protein
MSVKRRAIHSRYTIIHSMKWEKIPQPVYFISLLKLIGAQLYVFYISLCYMW